MRHPWLAGLLIAIMPAMALADHRGGGFGGGFRGGNFGGGYRHYDGGHSRSFFGLSFGFNDFDYAPVRYYNPPVYYAPAPTVVYSDPGYYVSPAPTVIYSAPPAYCPPPVIVSPGGYYSSPRSGYYSGSARFYYGR